MQTKCNAIEMAAVGIIFEFENEKTPLCKRSKLKWDSHASIGSEQFSLCPTHFYFAQGLVIVKIDKIPLAQF